jgi:hypothetical protein
MKTACFSPTTSVLKALDTTDGFTRLLSSMAYDDVLRLAWVSAAFVLSANLWFPFRTLGQFMLPHHDASLQMSH